MTDKLRLYSATVEVDVLYYATSDDPFDAIDAAREALRDCGAEASACPQEVTCEEDALGAHARGGQDAADAMIVNIEWGRQVGAPVCVLENGDEEAL